jgi:hypothetical protein
MVPREANMILKAGLLTAAVCGAWAALCIALGWHTDPTLLNLFLVAVLLQLAILAGALRRVPGTRRDLLGRGALISLVAGVGMAAVSLALFNFVFPAYFNEVRSAYAAMLTASGSSTADVERAMAAYSSPTTPAAHAVQAFAGNLGVGVIGTVILSLWLGRARRA